MTQTQVFNEEKAGAFAERLIGTLAEASVALQISVGHQLGLFETMGSMAPSTSEDIAAASGLNERYVREWLGAMVTGRVIDYDPAAKTYVLSPEHAHFLTNAGGADNMARLMPMVTLLARTRFFGQGHRLSGLDAAQLGIRGRAITQVARTPRGAH